MFLLCRQTDKEFRLPWPSFVRVEIYYKYRLSINRKYRRPELWIFHSEVVRALASKPSGHEFESRTISFFFPHQGFFLFPCFSFFLNFEVKQCGNLYWKYDNTGFAMEKKPSFFYFFKVANTQRNGSTIRHIAWLHLSSFLFKIQCFYQDKNNLDPDDQH